MKTALTVLFILFAATCFAQTAGVLPNQPVVIEVPDHPQHAEHHALACERPLVGGGPETYVVLHGERPLSDFGLMSIDPEPLGDVARAYRKQKAATKKAGIVFEKQGS